MQAYQKRVIQEKSDLDEKIERLGEYSEVLGERVKAFDKETKRMQKLSDKIGNHQHANINVACLDCGKDFTMQLERTGPDQIEIKAGAIGKRGGGYLFKCPKCFEVDQSFSRNCEIYSRVVSYLRPVRAWNDAKRQEFGLRQNYEQPPQESRPGNQSMSRSVTGFENYCPARCRRTGQCHGVTWFKHKSVKPPWELCRGDCRYRQDWEKDQTELKGRKERS